MSTRDDTPEPGDFFKAIMAGKPRVEPSAEFRDAAKQMRGIFTALTDEGFNEDQALALLAKMMTSGRAQ